MMDICTIRMETPYDFLRKNLTILCSDHTYASVTIFCMKWHWMLVKTTSTSSGATNWLLIRVHFVFFFLQKIFCVDYTKKMKKKIKKTDLNSFVWFERAIVHNNRNQTLFFLNQCTVTHSHNAESAKSLQQQWQTWKIKSQHVNFEDSKKFNQFDENLMCFNVFYFSLHDGNYFMRSWIFHAKTGRHKSTMWFYPKMTLVDIF